MGEPVREPVRVPVRVPVPVTVTVTVTDCSRRGQPWWEHSAGELTPARLHGPWRGRLASNECVGSAPAYQRARRPSICGPWGSTGKWLWSGAATSPVRVGRGEGEGEGEDPGGCSGSC